MSRNRRPQRGWALYARDSWRESMAFLGAKLRKDERRDAKGEEEGGDCAACGWITARDTCPMCGAIILDEVSA